MSTNIKPAIQNIDKIAYFRKELQTIKATSVYVYINSNQPGQSVPGWPNANTKAKAERGLVSAIMGSCN